MTRNAPFTAYACIAISLVVLAQVSAFSITADTNVTVGRVIREPTGLGVHRGAREVTIIDGTEVSPEFKYPYVVAVLTPQGDNSYTMCGGTLIGPMWVLTAAHCEPTTDTIVNIHAHYAFSQDPRREEGRVSAVATYVKIHDGYDGDSLNLENDIALIKLDRVVTHAGFMHLPEEAGDSAFEAGGTMVTAAGWGTTNDGTTSDVLREVPLPVFSFAQCDDDFWRRLVSSQMCAGYSDDGADTCQGDSGGPLWTFRANGEPVQLGVTSFGAACGGGVPGVYTRVASFITWIKAEINNQGGGLYTPSCETASSCGLHGAAVEDCTCMCEVNWAGDDCTLIDGSACSCQNDGCSASTWTGSTFTCTLDTPLPVPAAVAQSDSCFGQCGGTAPSGCQCAHPCTSNCCEDYQVWCLGPTPAPEPAWCPDGRTGHNCEVVETGCECERPACANAGEWGDGTYRCVLAA